MTKEQVLALDLTPDQKKVVDRVYVATAKTKKAPAFETMDEAGVRDYIDKKLQADLFQVIKKAIAAGVTVESIKKKIEAMAKSKVNAAVDKEIAALNKKLKELQKKKI